MQVYFEFLWKRKCEYSRYFYASYFKPKEVDKIFDEVTGLTKNENVELIQAEARKNCEDFIFRPRRNRNSKETSPTVQ